VTPVILSLFPSLPHTQFTYHRTWETGLETEIRVADFSPAFFCLRNPLRLLFPLCLSLFSEAIPRLRLGTKYCTAPTHPDHPHEPEYPPLRASHRI